MLAGGPCMGTQVTRQGRVIASFALPPCSGQPVAEVGQPYTRVIENVPANPLSVSIDFYNPYDPWSGPIGYLGNPPTWTYNSGSQQVTVTGTVMSRVQQRGEGAADILITLVLPFPWAFSWDYVPQAVCFKN